jgi:uncharacterized protein (DUF2062 family)
MGQRKRLIVMMIVVFAWPLGLLCLQEQQQQQQQYRIGLLLLLLVLWYDTLQHTLTCTLLLQVAGTELLYR